jgi:hypothetical protein
MVTLLLKIKKAGGGVLKFKKSSETTGSIETTILGLRTGLPDKILKKEPPKDYLSKA